MGDAEDRVAARLEEAVQKMEEALAALKSATETFSYDVSGHREEDGDA